MKRRYSVASLVLVLALAACSAPLPPVPLVLTRVAPVAVFGGDCASVLGDEAVAEVFGEQPGSPVSTDSPLLSPALAALGGLSCGWAIDASRNASLWFAPAAAVESIPAAPVSCQWNFRSDCFFEAVVSGYWIGGILPSLGGSDQPALVAAAEGLVELVAPKAQAAGAPVVPAAAAGTTKNCFALSRDAEVPERFGDDALRYRDTEASGRRETVVRESAAETVCEWLVDDAVDFTVELVPGAGWLVDEAADEPRSEPVVVQGARAVVVTDDASSASVYATDGVNLITLRPSHPGMPVDDLLPIALALLRAAT